MCKGKCVINIVGRIPRFYQLYMHVVEGCMRVVGGKCALLLSLVFNGFLSLCSLLTYHSLIHPPPLSSHRPSQHSYGFFNHNF